MISSILVHQDKIWSLSAHPTLPLIATASTDLTSKVLRLSKTLPEVATLEGTHSRSVRSVAFKPPVGAADFLDLPALAAGSFDSTISVWGLDEPDDTYSEEEILANQAAILSSGKNEWNLMAVIEGHENEVKCVAWNHSGNFLASCSRDKTVWIWETDPETLEEFECIAVLNDHQHDVKHVAWHPNENLLASSSYDDTIRLYKQDPVDDDWSCVAVLDGHEGTVWCSQFEHPSSPLAKEGVVRLVSVSDDLTARIWSCSEASSPKSDMPSSIKTDINMTWEEETVLPKVHKYAIYSVAWSKSGRIATTGADGQIVVYRYSECWEVERVFKAAHGVYEVNAVIWGEMDGEEVLVSGGEDGRVNIFTVSTASEANCAN